jgi:hypothetical protein
LASIQSTRRHQRFSGAATDGADHAHRNHKDVMGERTNGVWMNVLGWTATIAMFAAAIGLVVTWGSPSR